MDDLQRQIELRAEARRLIEDGPRLRHAAERAVELVEERAAAAAREPFARQAHQLAQRGEADAFEEEQFFFTARRFKRHLFELLAFATCKPQRRARGGCAGERGAEA